MSWGTMKTYLTILLWGTLLAATLSIARWPIPWEHAVCGPWGCGPTTQALIACHLAWIVVLTPAALLLRSWQHKRTSRIGWTLIVLALAAILALVAHQRLAWFPEASQWQRSYFWHRCVFCIAVAIDYPMVQTLMIGILLVVGARRRTPPPGDHNQALTLGTEKPNRVNEAS